MAETVRCNEVRNSHGKECTYQKTRPVKVEKLGSS
jgi:hypothetical protein